jgi:hypothetical protein
MMGKHHMSQYIEDLCIHNIEVIEVPKQFVPMKGGKFVQCP